MAIGDVYQIVRQVYVDGNAHFNVLHVIDDQASGDNREDTIAAIWDNTSPAPATDAPEARLYIMMRGAVEIIRDKLTVQRISPTKGEVFEYGFEARTPPTLSAGLPTFCSVLFTIATTLNSRSGKGGLFVGALAESDTTNNQVTTTFGSSFATPFVNALLESFTPAGDNYGGFTLGVWSRLLNQFNPVQTISFGSLIGTQRSRKQGRGI